MLQNRELLRHLAHRVLSMQVADVSQATTLAHSQEREWLLATVTLGVATTAAWQEAAALEVQVHVYRRCRSAKYDLQSTSNTKRALLSDEAGSSSHGTTANVVVHFLAAAVSTARLPRPRGRGCLTRCKLHRATLGEAWQITLYCTEPHRPI